MQLDECTKALEKANKTIERLQRKPAKKSELEYQAKLASIGEENAALKKQLKQAVKKHGIFQAIAAELETVITPLDEPEPVRVEKKNDIVEDLVVCLSDEHADEIIEPHQVGGLEDYNFQVALCRAEKYVDTIIQWSQETLKNHQFPTLHILALGDHTSGEIHGIKERSEHRNMFRNSLAIGQMHALMFRDLAPYFQDIKIYCISGNHGRQSQKKDFNNPWENYDYLVHEISRIYCKDLDNVEFAIPESWSMTVNINGFNFGLEHGDSIRSWMSIPYYGIERKTRRLTALHHATDTKVDNFVMGHFHKLSMNSDLKGECIINGAWAATNPYSYESFSGYREPVQLCFGVHHRWGLTWRLPIKIKDPIAEKRGPERYKVELAHE